MLIDALHINRQPDVNPIAVEIPNNYLIHSTHTCKMDLPRLLLAAWLGHIVLQFPAGTLILIRLLCNHRYTAHLDYCTLSIIRNSTIILRGVQSPVYPRWCINLKSQVQTIPPPHRTKRFSHTAQVLKCTSFATIPFTPCGTVSQRIVFMYTALGSPILSTLCKALDAGFLTLMLEITASLMHKYPPPSISMIKGHLDRVLRKYNLHAPHPPPHPLNYINSNAHCYTTIPPDSAEYPPWDTTTLNRRTSPQSLRHLFLRNWVSNHWPNWQVSEKSYFRQHRYTNTAQFQLKQHPRQTYIVTLRL